jgi:hypothetical protein
MGALTSPNPVGLPSLLQGQLYFFYLNTSSSDIFNFWSLLKVRGYLYTYGTTELLFRMSRPQEFWKVTEYRSVDWSHLKQNTELRRLMNFLVRRKGENVDRLSDCQLLKNG